MADRPNIKADADAQSSGYTSNAEVNSTSTTNSGSESHLSAQGACALPTENSPGINDTLPKSVCPRLDHGNISQGGDFTSRNYSSVIGCLTPDQGPILQGQLGDTSQDISLNSHITWPTPSCSAHLPSPLSPPCMASSSTDPCHVSTECQASLQMNIPPSVPSERFENTDVASGIAEMQLSFQGVPQSVTLPHALPPVENPLTIMAQSRESSTFISSGTEDNLTVSYLPCNAVGSAHMTARPISLEGPTAQASPVSSQLSHSDSQISLKTEISDNCQVRKLPKSILNFISIEMEGKERSWEDLVEQYGWNYNDTQRFATRHPTDVFLALLREPHFQTYTLSQLRSDLDRLPRKDLLFDLDEKIQSHNAQVQAGL